MHYNVEGLRELRLKTKVVHKGEWLYPQSAVEPEQFPYVEYLAGVGQVPASIEPLEGLVFGPPSRTLPTMICAEKVTDHTCGRIRKRMKAVRKEIKSELKELRKAWNAKKRAVQEAALKAALRREHYVKYRHAAIHISREWLMICKDSHELLRLYTPSVSPRAHLEARSVWTPKAIQAQLRVGKYSLDFSWDPFLQREMRASFANWRRNQGITTLWQWYQMNEDTVLSRFGWAGSRVKDGWAPIQVYMPAQARCVTGPIGEFLLSEKVRRLTAKELRELRARRGEYFQFSKLEALKATQAWIEQNPHPSVDSKRFESRRKWLKDADLYLRRHIQFQQAVAFSYRTAEKAVKRDTTISVRWYDAPTYQDQEVDREEMINIDTPERHRGWEFNTAWFGRMPDRDSNILSPCMFISGLQGDDERHLTVYSHQGFLLGRKGAPTLLDNDGFPSQGEHRLLRQLEIARSDVRQKAIVTDISSKPGIYQHDPLDRSWSRLIQQVAFARDRLGNLEVGPPRLFNLARSTVELRDTGQTADGVKQFIAWCSTYKNRTPGSILGSKAGKKFGGVMLASLKLQACAQAYLWWKFGVEPTLGDINLLMSDCRIVFTTVRDNFYSLFTQAGLALEPVTAKQFNITSKDWAYGDDWDIPTLGWDDRLDVQIPVFPQPVGLGRHMRVKPRRWDGKILLDNAEIATELRDGSGAADGYLSFTGSFVDAEPYVSRWEPGVVPTPPDEIIDELERGLANSQVQHTMRLLSQVQRLAGRSCVFGRFDFDRINRLMAQKTGGWTVETFLNRVFDWKPLVTLWEIQPLSFVLDWLVTTREIIDSLQSMIHSMSATGELKGELHDGQGYWLSQRSTWRVGRHLASWSELSFRMERPAFKVVNAGGYDWAEFQRTLDDDVDYQGFREMWYRNTATPNTRWDPDKRIHRTAAYFLPFISLTSRLSLHASTMNVSMDEYCQYYRRGRIAHDLTDWIPRVKLNLNTGKMISLCALLINFLPLGGVVTKHGGRMLRPLINQGIKARPRW